MRNVIVTGGSRGLGLEIARKLAAEGYRVLAIARTVSDEMAPVIEEAERSRPGSLVFVAFDLEDIESIPQLVRKLYKQFGPIYGLVNNAAVGLEGALGTMPNADIEKVIRLNTLSPIV